MDAVYVGWLSILPPMIAIILALITKEVLFSLIAGVLSGTIIYSIASGMNPIVGPVSTVFDVMIQKADMNIIIFCFLLGGLVYLINASGGAQASGSSHLYQVGQLLSVVILKIQVLLTLNLKPLLRLFHTIFTPFLAFLWFFSSVSFPWILVLWQNRRY